MILLVKHTQTLNGVAVHDREVAEDAIDHLRDVDGSIIEPRFSFFQLLPE